jgi:hypothetical protein
VLALQAVLAVLKHKLAEAADAGQSKGSAAASAAAKQHVDAAQKEAEAKAAKQLQCMAEQVGCLLCSWDVVAKQCHCHACIQCDCDTHCSMGADAMMMAHPILTACDICADV